MKPLPIVPGIILCLMLVACSTVAPEVKPSAPAAYTGNSLGAATYIAKSKSKGFELSDGQRAEYNSLIDTYGNGTLVRPITPPLVKDAGVTQIDGAWWQDAEHQVLYRDMRDWRDNGIRPPTIINRLLQ